MTDLESTPFDIDELRARIDESVNSALNVSERVANRVIETATDPLSVVLAHELAATVRTVRQLRKLILVETGGI